MRSHAAPEDQLRDLGLRQGRRDARRVRLAADPFDDRRLRAEVDLGAEPHEELERLPEEGLDRDGDAELGREPRDAEALVGAEEELGEIALPALERDAVPRALG